MAGRGVEYRGYNSIGIAVRDDNVRGAVENETNDRWPKSFINMPHIECGSHLSQQLLCGG